MQLIKEIEKISISTFDYAKKDVVQFLYTGNIGAGRYKVLSDIAKALKEGPKAVVVEEKVVTREEELIACPFCGSENLKLVENHGSYGYALSSVHILCVNCGAKSGDVEGDAITTEMKLRVISKWNTRRLGTFPKVEFDNKGLLIDPEDD